MEFIVMDEESRLEAHTTPFWQNRERSELNCTEKSAALWLDGRRQKMLSAICPRNAGELP
ncbi:hypothetical protein [Providencia sp. PROV178]|uniref:hypothetical protein n=1 Tax=Providencia sp. PROV178 TaxID=2949881 RepID=UPI00234A5F0B|nr:hypothetical protein [Providencia sp. PROV178]